MFIRAFDKNNFQNTHQKVIISINWNIISETILFTLRIVNSFIVL